MPSYDDVTQPFIATIEHEDKRLQVSVRIVYDGIEFTGRLWFAEESWDDVGIPDRGQVNGQTREEVIERAKGLPAEQLVLRYLRAVSEKRRYKTLRKSTEEVLSKIRYLNQVSISMRAGLLDVSGAANEIELTERQLHELVDRLRSFAGQEEG
ncbi:MAG: hypothetical protein HYX65_12775 [Gemmatimonadetes bacterium]|nr:hypothetical protein [Gemmatimonadota bacterium]